MGLINDKSLRLIQAFSLIFMVLAVINFFIPWYANVNIYGEWDRTLITANRDIGFASSIIGSMIVVILSLVLVTVLPLIVRKNLNKAKNIAIISLGTSITGISYVILSMIYISTYTLSGGDYWEYYKLLPGAWMSLFISIFSFALTLAAYRVIKGISKRDMLYHTAQGYEKAMNYSAAAELYEKIGMYEDARRCRELAMKQRETNAQPQPTSALDNTNPTQGTSPKAAHVAAVGVHEVRDMYGAKEEKNVESMYNWGEFTAYRVINKIGGGGFSEVYLVEKEGNRYAMKIPRGIDFKGEDTVVLKKEDLEQYAKEAEIWALLTEKVPQAVVNLIDAGIHPFPWFVMELADTSLRRSAKSMDYEEKLKVAINLLGKLDKIHHFGVVHKDIKPENILHANREWKFTDFGLSKIINKSSKSSHMMSGTLLYMAPEQISKKKFGGTDWRTDIWQMGVMMYELLTGHTPFEAEDAWEITGMVLRDDPIPATEYGVDERVWKVIEKALQKDKNARWQSAAEMKRELEVVL